MQMTDAERLRQARGRLDGLSELDRDNLKAGRITRQLVLSLIARHGRHVPEWPLSLYLADRLNDLLEAGRLVRQAGGEDAQ